MPIFASASAVIAPSLVAAVGDAAAPPAARRIPAVEQRWAYGLRYAHEAITSLAGPHRLRPERCTRHAAVIHPPAGTAERWANAFGVDAARRPAFLYAQSAGTLLYLRLFNELGLDLRHLLHVRHTSRGATSLAVDGPQRVTASLRRLAAVGRTKALVVLGSTVEPLDGGAALDVEDHFLVRRFDECWTDALPREDGMVRTLRRQQQLEPRFAATAGTPVPIDATLPRRFGALSGDRNPVHTTRLGAWLACRSKPFLQGLATRNLVAAEFARAGLSLAWMAIDFVRPVHAGQTVRFAHDGERFEIVDGARRVLAQGRVDAMLG